MFRGSSVGLELSPGGPFDSVPYLKGSNGKGKPPVFDVLAYDEGCFVEEFSRPSLGSPTVRHSELFVYYCELLLYCELVEWLFLADEESV